MAKYRWYMELVRVKLVVGEPEGLNTVLEIGMLRPKMMGLNSFIGLGAVIVLALSSPAFARDGSKSDKTGTSTTSTTSTTDERPTESVTLNFAKTDGKTKKSKKSKK